MDRNHGIGNIPLHIVVALRKESVDRNSEKLGQPSSVNRSLSARRAWIEMQVFQRIAKPFRGSLSARRAWIEIDGVVSGSGDYVRRSPQGERG